MIFRAASVLPGLLMAHLAVANESKSRVVIDGSSTVFPISEAMAEEFGAVDPKVRVTVGSSGTGGGFKKATLGEVDIVDASRPIKDSERADAAKKKIEFIEIGVGYDGLTVVVNPSNAVTSISFAQLKKVWEPQSKVKLWSDIDPSWPKETIALFGPGADSGTFDYFTETIVGKARASRADFTSSEDDNVLLRGVASSKWALAYFGHGYYMANKNKVKALTVDNGKGAVDVTDANIASGKYPLSRMLYIYVNKASASRPEVDSFVKFYLQNAKKLVHETGYLPLNDKQYADGLSHYISQAAAKKS